MVGWRVEGWQKQREMKREWGREGGRRWDRWEGERDNEAEGERGVVPANRENQMEKIKEVARIERMKGEKEELRAGDKEWTRGLIESKWGEKYRLGLVEKVFERQSETVWEGDRVAKQIKRGEEKGMGGWKNGRTKRVKSDGKASLVHPGWKLNHSYKLLASDNRVLYMRACFSLGNDTGTEALYHMFISFCLVLHWSEPKSHIYWPVYILEELGSCVKVNRDW